jgi:hypothetical protein
MIELICFYPIFIILYQELYEELYYYIRLGSIYIDFYIRLIIIYIEFYVELLIHFIETSLYSFYLYIRSLNILLIN